MNEQLATVTQIRSRIIDLGVRFGPKLLTAILIIIVGVLVSRAIGRWFDRALRHVDMEPPVRVLMSRIARILVVGMFGILALQNLGVELLPLIAGLGVAGAGIALAMQGVLSNVVAGLTIIFTKPYRVGQYISIVGVEGRVDVISLFNTVLSHPDRSLVVVPNRKIVGEVLHNYGHIRQLDINVPVAYDTDLNTALAAVQSTLLANKRILQDPKPLVRATVLADSAITIGVGPWVAVTDYGDAHGEITQSIVETFRARGISIPLPQREVRMLSAAHIER
jgi:small conductance mechanosensitive channel